MPAPMKGTAATATANVTLTTTSETVIISSVAESPPYDTSLIIIWAWAQLTTGGSTTAVTPRIRRGTLITDTLVGEANAISIASAAGGTDEYSILVVESAVSGGRPVYSLTLQQTGAAGNGTALQAAIVVAFI